MFAILIVLILIIICLQIYRNRKLIKSYNEKERIESNYDISLLKRDQRFRDRNRNLSKISVAIGFLYIMVVINFISWIIIIEKFDFWGQYGIGLIASVVFILSVIVYFIFIRAFQGIKNYLIFLLSEIRYLESRRKINNE